MELKILINILRSNILKIISVSILFFSANCFSLVWIDVRVGNALVLSGKCQNIIVERHISSENKSTKTST
jgi:uncharacterized membrane protein